MLAPLLLLVVRSALRPDPDRARTWLQRELDRADYRQSLRERFLGWLSHLWDTLTGGALLATPLSTGAAILVAVTVATLVVLLLSRVRRDPRTDRGTGRASVVTGTSPEQHRDAAEAALDRGDHETAVVEAFRALATRAVRRGLVDERPGLTAHELVADLAPRFPDRAGDLVDAADGFDGVFYGDQHPAAADARALLDLDRDLASARPAQPSAGTVDHTAVPR